MDSNGQSPDSNLDHLYMFNQSEFHSDITQITDAEEIVNHRYGNIIGGQISFGSFTTSDYELFHRLVHKYRYLIDWSGDDLSLFLALKDYDFYYNTLELPLPEYPP